MTEEKTNLGAAIPSEAKDLQSEAAIELKNKLKIKRPRKVSKSGLKKAPSADEKRTRAQRPFPASSFEEAIGFAKNIADFGSGKPVRRLAIFDHLKKSPESGQSRMLVTNANKYGLIEGGYTAEFLKLTESGAKATNDELPIRERTKARIKLAIDDIPVFSGLFAKYVGNKLPARAALVDSAVELGIVKNLAEEAVDTFVVNLRYLGLLLTLSGAERIIAVDYLLDTMPTGQSTGVSKTAAFAASVANGSTASAAVFDETCFYISPIGEEYSEQRKHADLLLGAIVEPALEQFNLKVVRADMISKPGVIGKQIIDYIVNSKLVIVDLSFHNPNVFYELAIRHMIRKPIVQITRKSDKVPFDINQSRTIVIDLTDLYTFVPKMQTYTAEVANQIRSVYEDPDSADNPISLFYPNLKVQSSS